MPKILMAGHIYIWLPKNKRASTGVYAIHHIPNVREFHTYNTPGCSQSGFFLCGILLTTFRAQAGQYYIGMQQTIIGW